MSAFPENTTPRDGDSPERLLQKLILALRGWTSIVEVTPSNSTVLSAVRGIWVGGAGNLAMTFADGTSGILYGVPAGTQLPGSCVKILATGTTATNISILL